jgi:transposase
MKFCIAAFRGNNSKISLEPQREVLSAAKRRSCWELKNLSSNFIRDEFSAIRELQ